MPKIDISQPLISHDGTVMKLDKGDATIKAICTRALINPLLTGPDKPENTTPDEKGKRFAVASSFHASSEPDIAQEDIGRILHCVDLYYAGSSVYGALLVLLDPSKARSLGIIFEDKEQTKDAKPPKEKTPEGKKTKT